MTDLDPVCNRADCTAPNHCDHHARPIHHPVDSMADHCAARHKAPAQLEAS